MSDKKYWTEVITKRDDGQEDKTRIYVVKPSNAINKEADRYRAKTWQKCIADGILTRQEVEKVLADRKIWDETKKKEEEDLKAQMEGFHKQLFLGNGDTKRMKLSEGKDLAIKMREIRLKLRQLISIKLSMEENCAEALSDNARYDYIVAACTFDENDAPVYKDIEDYNSRSEDTTAFAAAAKLGEVLFGLDGKFEQNLPENKWLKKYKLVDDELNLVNRDGKTVHVDGRVIDKEGYYLDAQGKRVDKDGNPLTDDGEYQSLVEYEDDTETVTTDS